jgi:hypothetical protein
MIDGNDLNTADALNSNKRGAYLEITSVSYSTTPDETQVVIEKAIGLVGYTIEVDVNGNTDTGVVAADGEVTIVVAGTLAAGTYTVTAKVTNAGSEYGSFTTTTFTV